MAPADEQVDERITQFQSVVSPKLPVPKDDPSIITDTATGETIRVLRRPDPAVVSDQLDSLWQKGIKSIAIAFVHSYLWGEHEQMVAEIAREKGFEVSVSSTLQPMVGSNLRNLLTIDQTRLPGQLIHRRCLLDTGDTAIHRVLRLRLRRRYRSVRQ